MQRTIKNKFPTATSPLHLLDKITTSLGLIGGSLLLITLLNAILLLTIITGTTFLDKSVHFVAACMITAASFISAFTFERQRKNGEAIFEEISDDLHWHIGYKKDPEPGETAGKKPELEARVILRTFAKATDLPLIPGRFGPAVYAGLNIGMISIIAYLLSSWKA